MRNCVNPKHPDVLKLSAELNMAPFYVASLIGAWQTANNTLELPTANQIRPTKSNVSEQALAFEEAVAEFKSNYKVKEIYRDIETVNKLITSAVLNPKYGSILFGTKSSSSGFSITYNDVNLRQLPKNQDTSSVNPELNEKLKAILASIGVKYEAVDQIKDSEGKKIDAVGIANILHNLVQIVETNQGKDTLAEETAHMIIALMGKDHVLYKAMKNAVVGTEVYEQVVQEYSNIYNGNIDKLQEEAMGKMVAKMIVSQFESQPIENLWQRILRWLGSRLGLLTSEQKDVFAKVADSILKNEFTGQRLPSESTESFFQLETPFKRQIAFIKRRKATLERLLPQTKEGTRQHASRTKELETITQALDSISDEVSEQQAFKTVGFAMLSNLDTYISELEADPNSSIRKESIEFINDTLDAWDDFKDLRDTVADLRDRLFPLSRKFIETTVNEFATETEPITWEMIDSQNEDIGTVRMGTGSLSDVPNYLARTVGAVIKQAQNKTTAMNAEFGNKLNDELKLLYNWADNKGISHEDVFDYFIDERKTKNGVTTELVREHKGGSLNPKYQFIQNNPALKRFYEFYQDTLESVNTQVPEKVNKHFIPNIKKSNFEWNPKNWVKDKTFEYDSFVGREDLFADLVPSGKFKGFLPVEDKSKHLGESLLKLKMYANNYEQMSDALPTVRILQDHIAYKYSNNEEKPRMEREFKTSSDPSKQVIGEKSNLYHMVDKYIDMQVKGKMKLKEGKFHSQPVFDSEGKVIGETYMHASEVGDFLLKWNSLVRIGLSPITAVSNVIFGDISNVLEGVGGRFFSVGELKSATNIFTSQYFNKDSTMHQLLDKVNPLQELDDYEQISKVRVKKKLDADTLKEKMYSLQKGGEVFLQTRTMLAVMIHDGLLTKDGKLTEDGETLLKNDRAIEKLRDKVQRLNDMIHGRYSTRDAAIASQRVWYRMVFQFRKWIPAAYENRFGKYQWDNRLGADFEGRYVTMSRLLRNLSDTRQRIQEGNLTELELYNIKKQLTEVLLLVASLTFYMAFIGGEDDKEWRKDPFVKTVLTFSNRIAGDLEFWYNPKNFTNLAKNTVPVAKLVDDTIDALWSVPHAMYTGDWKYKTGSREGQNIPLTKFSKVIPVAKPIGDFVRLWSDNDLEEFR